MTAAEDKRRARKSYVTKVARVARQDMVQDVKGNQCYDCGEEVDPVCLDLEHTDPSTKVASISWLVRNGTLAELMDELEKVIPVCANCHRLRTFYGSGYSGNGGESVGQARTAESTDGATAA